MYFWGWLVALMVKICLQCRRLWFILWVGKIPWRREWLPTPVFLPVEMHGQRSLARLQSTESQRVRHNWATKHTAQNIFLKTKPKRSFTWIMKFHCFQQSRYMVSLKPWLYIGSAALSRLPGTLLVKSCLTFHTIYFEAISDNCADHAVYVSWLWPI